MPSSEPADRSHHDAALGAAVLGVMAKYWAPGAVKTRLGKTVGMETSAKLHRCFLRHLMRFLGGGDQICELSFTPNDRIPDAEAFFKQIRASSKQINASSWQVAQQGEGDLGDRMNRWFIRHLHDPSCRDPSCHDPSCRAANHRAVLIGADCPLIDQASIQEAFASLEEHDVVLGPALDGGYYLIGIRHHDARLSVLLETLFSGMLWSHPSLYQTTIDRLDSGHWSYALLEPREDIDTMKELQNLIATLESDPASSAHRDLLAQIHTLLQQDQA